jgi:hypothetical protein
VDDLDRWPTISDESGELHAVDAHRPVDVGEYDADVESGFLDPRGLLERFPGRLNLGVFSCWREYDSSVLL